MKNKRPNTTKELVKILNEEIERVNSMEIPEETPIGKVQSFKIRFPIIFSHSRSQHCMGIFLL